MERTPWQDEKLGGIGFLKAGLISAGAIGALVLVGALWVSGNDARTIDSRVAAATAAQERQAAQARAIREEARSNREEARSNREEARSNRKEARSNREEARSNREEARSNREEARATETVPQLPAAPASSGSNDVDETAAGTDVAQDEATVTYDEAEAAFLERDYERAEQLFARYAAGKPANAWGHYMHGLSLWKNGRYEEARAALGQSIALDSTHFKSYTNLARVLLDEGLAKEALIPARRAIELVPESSTGFLLFGRAAHSLGLADEASAAYEQAIDRNRDDAWALNNLGLIHIEREQFDAAVPPLARAAMLRPEVATFRNNLGVALERTGQYTLAAEQFENVLLLNESHEKAGISLSRVERLLDDGHQETEIDLARIAASYGLEDEAVPADPALAQSSPE